MHGDVLHCMGCGILQLVVFTHRLALLGTPADCAGRLAVCNFWWGWHFLVWPCGAFGGSMPEFDGWHFSCLVWPWHGLAMQCLWNGCGGCPV